MRAAVIKLSAVTGTITNVIVADADKDYPPDKTSILVNLPDDHPAGQGWTWDSESGFTHVEVALKLKQIEDVPLTTVIAVDAPPKPVVVGSSIPFVVDPPIDPGVNTETETNPVIVSISSATGV